MNQSKKDSDLEKFSFFGFFQHPTIMENVVVLCLLWTGKVSKMPIEIYHLLLLCRVSFLFSSVFMTK